MRSGGYILTFGVLVGTFSLVYFFITGSVTAQFIEHETNKVVVRDYLGPRVHRLSGMVMVQSDCHELLSKSREIDTQNYLLEFRTWENPNRICNSEDVPRQFHLTVFAPSTGIAFQATLDDIVVPLEVIPDVK